MKESIYVIYGWVETLIRICGVEGSAVPVVRHAVMAVVAGLLAFISYVICRRLIVPAVMKITAHTKAKWDDALLGRPVLISACGIVPAIVVWETLPLVFLEIPMVHELLERFTAIYITIMSTRLVMAFLNAFNVLDTPAGQNVQQYIRSFCGLLKIIAVCVGVIISFAILIGKNPVSLFAGLGAASAILMLVFKDTIEGLVAGIRLTSADMVHVGDWITVPSANANGTVVEMNLTTVKIQNFDKTITTVSPTTLVNGSFQNWKGMQESEGGRRVTRKLYIDFRSIHFVEGNTTDLSMSEGKAGNGRITNLLLYRHAMEDYLRNDPRINASGTVMVHQLEATQAGLPIEFYFFLKDKTSAVYEENIAQIMEYAYAQATEFGLKIYQQYPEQ